MENLSPYVTFIGRVLLSLMFVMAGANKLGSYDATMQYIATSAMPMPQLAYVGAVAIELGGGLALLIGFQARIAAAALCLFSLLAALFFHTNFADQVQMILFLKNITIMGGMLLIVAHGAGGFSLDNRRKA